MGLDWNYIEQFISLAWNAGLSKSHFLRQLYLTWGGLRNDSFNFKSIYIFALHKKINNLRETINKLRFDSIQDLDVKSLIIVRPHDNLS